MSDTPSNAEESLRKLGLHARRGWERTRPVTSEELEKVRRAVREQWEKEQSHGQSKAPDKSSPAQDQQQSQESERRKSKGRDHDQDQTQ
jgi:uncharacterized protein with WD repeat